MIDPHEIERLEASARRIRANILRQIHVAGSGHPGGSMSCVEILTALFVHRIQPPAGWFGRNARDRVILSKGHAAPALYAAFAEVGMIPDAELDTLRQLGSRLQGHPDRTRLPEVEMSTGSLGQGLSVSLGIALALELRNEPYYSYAILGDGEINSGQIWEAVAYAGAHKVDRLVAILDANGIQNDGRIEEVLELRPYAPKFEAFGWAVRECDGQTMAEVVAAVDWASSDAPGKKPRLVIAHTTKGAGVSFMSDRADWHSHTINDAQLTAALEEVMG
ncbi:MAG: transketolase [Ancalomicrobiaceae bacterium]|nr:transketolase [Ancalomicrobiaceae bacterium]